MLVNVCNMVVMQPSATRWSCSHNIVVAKCQKFVNLGMIFLLALLLLITWILSGYNEFPLKGCWHLP